MGPASLIQLYPIGLQLFLLERPPNITNIITDLIKENDMGCPNMSGNYHLNYGKIRPLYTLFKCHGMRGILKSMYVA